MIPKDIRESIARYCARMDQKGWVANHDGNITVRSGDALIATPGARAKGDLEASDMIELDASGKKRSGQGNPFSELAAHLRVYSKRADVHAVVHAHPPYATAVGCANQEMLTAVIPEAVVSIGPGIPLVGLALPGSDALWTEFDLLLPHYDAVLIAGNGVFTWGTSLEQAFLRMELVEHLARILCETIKIGAPSLLSPDQVKALLKKRADAGLALPPDPARPHWFP